MAEKPKKKRRPAPAGTAGRATKPILYLNPPPPAANPPRRRAVTRRGGPLLGPVESGARQALPIVSGMLAAKLIQRWGGTGADERSPWTWQDYARAAAGTLGASLVAGHLLRVPTGTQSLVLAGGLGLLGFKLVTSTLVPMSATATKFLGTDGREYLPGANYTNGLGESYVLGADGQWLPADDGHRLLGDTLRTPGSLGDTLRQPGSLGQDDPIEEPIAAPMQQQPATMPRPTTGIRELFPAAQAGGRMW